MGAYACTKCGAEAIRWAAQCAACRAWNTIAPATAPVGALVHTGPKPPLPTRGSGWPITLPPAPPPLPDPEPEPAAEPPRLVSQICLEAPELARHALADLPSVDAVLGGGLVASSVVLLSAEPGLGKSTLAAQIAACVGRPSLYASGEETREQVAQRLARVGLGQRPIYVTSEIDARALTETARQLADLAVIVVDSIQKLYDPHTNGDPGTVNQIRACGRILARYAKDTNTTIVVVSQITKGGDAYGPKALEHDVDVLLELELPPEADEDTPARVLRCPRKNRYGATPISRVLTMTDRGFVDPLAEG